ncbi:hypothetical protein [Marinicella sp. W31]|uniref:hypothetical protein n=1 Tax=Marinicella sp. W31 TaxID=3023713 RepID=UPI0037573547
MRILVLLLLLFSHSGWAFEEIIVTPLQPQGWAEANVRDDAITVLDPAQPLFGDGSLLFATDTQTPGQDKADFQLTWQQSLMMIDFPDRTLGNLDALNYAWFKDSSSTTSAHLIPVVRVRFYDDAGTPGDLADDTTGVLVWEAIYNGINNPAEDTWQLSDIIDGNFWAFVNASPNGTGTINNYNSTLNDWITGSPQGGINDPSIQLDADTFIIGVNMGVGSGWGNSFIGYVDALRVGFGTDDILYNFEACSFAEENSDPDLIFNDGFDQCLKQ